MYHESNETFITKEVMNQKSITDMKKYLSTTTKKEVIQEEVVVVKKKPYICAFRTKPKLVGFRYLRRTVRAHHIGTEWGSGPTRRATP